MKLCQLKKDKMLRSVGFGIVSSDLQTSTSLQRGHIILGDDPVHFCTVIEALSRLARLDLLIQYPSKQSAITLLVSSIRKFFVELLF